MGVFIVAVMAIDHVLGQYHWREVVSHLYATPFASIVLALLLTLGSYFVLTFYDFLGVRTAGGTLRWRTVALASFTAYAVAHNVGFAAVSGGSVRYRIYSAAGLTGLQVAQVIAFCTLTFALGSALLTGVSLFVRPEMAGRVLHLGKHLAQGIGVGLIVAVVVYILTGYVRRRPLKFRGAVIRLPGPGVSLLQVAVACADLCLAAGVLFVLMPEGSTGGYIAFLGIYLIAAGAGLVSSVPGGLGVFESVLLLLTPLGAADAKLAGVLAFRVIYYVLPFLLALPTMLAHEAWAQRGLLARWWGRRR
jgi:uncharacterized membrane protein YbhN (UPF0104 family)